MNIERTPRTWGEHVWPTAQQLADWLKVCTDAELLAHAYIAIRDAQAHDHCLVAHDSTFEINRRVLKHEAETAMRGHDARGVCCLRARMTPSTTPTTETREDSRPGDSGAKPPSRGSAMRSAGESES